MEDIPPAWDDDNLPKLMMVVLGITVALVLVMRFALMMSVYSCLVIGTFLLICQPTFWLWLTRFALRTRNKRLGRFLITTRAYVANQEVEDIVPKEKLP
jgi:Flp pilus assembly protein TadB